MMLSDSWSLQLVTTVLSIPFTGNENQLPSISIPSNFHTSLLPSSLQQQDPSPPSWCHQGFCHGCFRPPRWTVVFCVHIRSLPDSRSRENTSLLLGYTRLSPPRLFQNSGSSRKARGGENWRGEEERTWDEEAGVGLAGGGVALALKEQNCKPKCVPMLSVPPPSLGSLRLIPHAAFFLFLSQFLRGTEASSLSMLQNLWSLILAPFPARVVGLSMSPLTPYPFVFCIYTREAAAAAAVPLLSLWYSQYLSGDVFNRF